MKNSYAIAPQNSVAKYSPTQLNKRSQANDFNRGRPQSPPPFEIELQLLPTDIHLAIERLSGYADLAPPQRLGKRKLRTLYLKAARKLHPDKHRHQNPERMASLFREAKECYEIALKKILELEKLSAPFGT